MADITELKQTDRLIDSAQIINNNFNTLSAQKADKDDVYTKTESDDNYLKLSGGELSGALTINENFYAPGRGIILKGAETNFAISVSHTGVTKGVAPDSTKYWGIDFYGKDAESYAQRIGLLETRLNTDRSSSTAIYAYNCSSNENTNNCGISVNVDSNGNIYTYAPTPANTDSSTKIATTAFVNGGNVVAKGTYYIRFASGLQICWGGANISKETEFTFAQGFTSPPITTSSCTANHLAYLTSLTTTAAKFACATYGSYVRYISIGYWK